MAARNLMLAALAATATAQIIECDGLRYPDPEACDAIAEALKADTGGSDCVDEAGLCVVHWVGDRDTKNCLISNCISGGDLCYPVGVSGLNYEQIKLTCIDKRAGGRFYTEILDTWTEAYLNPEYQPDTGSSSLATAGAEEDKTLHSVQMPIAEFEAWMQNATLPKTMKKFKRTSQAQKRADDDTEFDLVQQYNSIERPNVRYAIGGARPAGSSFTTTQEVSESVSLGVSSEISAGIEGIVSASIGVNFEETYTVASSVGETITYDCEPGQDGILYWYPVYDMYGGILRPSGDELEVWVPLSEGAANYRVECLG